VRLENPAAATSSSPRLRPMKGAKGILAIHGRTIEALETRRGLHGAAASWPKCASYGTVPISLSRVREAGEGKGKGEGYLLADISRQERSHLSRPRLKASLKANWECSAVGHDLSTCSNAACSRSGWMVTSKLRRRGRPDWEAWNRKGMYDDLRMEPYRDYRLNPAAHLRDLMFDLMRSSSSVG